MTRRNLSGLLVLIALVSGFGLHGPAAAASPCQRSLDYLADRYAAEPQTRAAFQAPELSPALAREFPELDGLEALCS